MVINMRTLPDSIQLGYLAVVTAQATHSIEEAATQLFAVWGPAAAVSGFFSDDLPTGFAIVNCSLVILGMLGYATAVRNSTAAAIPIIWFWVVLELANSVFHTLMGVNAGGYFPGLATVPFLFVGSVYLATHVLRFRSS